MNLSVRIVVSIWHLEEYGTNGDGFLRLNVATNRANVEDGMHRLKKSVEDFVRQR